MSMFNSKVKPKSSEEIAKIKESCTIVVKALAHVASLIRPGVTGNYLDKEAQRDNYLGHTAFKGIMVFLLFVHSLCAVVHEFLITRGKGGDVVSWLALPSEWFF